MLSPLFLKASYPGPRFLTGAGFGGRVLHPKDDDGGEVSAGGGLGTDNGVVTDGGGDGDGDGDGEEEREEDSNGRGEEIRIGDRVEDRDMTVCVALLTSPRWLTSLEMGLARPLWFINEAFVRVRELSCCCVVVDGPGEVARKPRL